MSFDNLRTKILRWLDLKEQKIRFGDALAMWKTDDGCKAIQSQCNGKEFYRIEKSRVDRAITELDELFEELTDKNWILSEPAVFYRGQSSEFKSPQAGYVACSFDREEAEAYGKVFKVRVWPGTPWIPFDSEREILLPRAYMLKNEFIKS